jgi:hypothetical protein
MSSSWSYKSSSNQNVSGKNETGANPISSINGDSNSDQFIVAGSNVTVTTVNGTTTISSTGGGGGGGNIHSINGLTNSAQLVEGDSTFGLGTTITGPSSTKITLPGPLNLTAAANSQQVGSADLSDFSYTIRNSGATASASTSSSLYLQANNTTKQLRLEMDGTNIANILSTGSVNIQANTTGIIASLTTGNIMTFTNTLNPALQMVSTGLNGISGVNLYQSNASTGARFRWYGTTQGTPVAGVTTGGTLLRSDGSFMIGGLGTGPIYISQGVTTQTITNPQIQISAAGTIILNGVYQAANSNSAVTFGPSSVSSGTAITSIDWSAGNAAQTLGTGALTCGDITSAAISATTISGSGNITSLGNVGGATVTSTGDISTSSNLLVTGTITSGDISTSGNVSISGTTSSQQAATNDTGDYAYTIQNSSALTTTTPRAVLNLQVGSSAKRLQLRTDGSGAHTINGTGTVTVNAVTSTTFQIGGTSILALTSTGGFSQSNITGNTSTVYRQQGTSNTGINSVDMFDSSTFGTRLRYYQSASTNTIGGNASGGTILTTDGSMYFATRGTTTYNIQMVVNSTANTVSFPNFLIASGTGNITLNGTLNPANANSAVVYSSSAVTSGSAITSLAFQAGNASLNLGTGTITSGSITSSGTINVTRLLRSVNTYVANGTLVSLTLAATLNQYHYFNSGTTNTTIQMIPTNTGAQILGFYRVYNNTTASITVQNSAGTQIGPALTQNQFMEVTIKDTTVAGGWWYTVSTLT